MNKDQSNTYNSEEELSLLDIFMIFWKQKTIIVSITLIAAILSGLFSKFVIEPVYTSNLNIVISMPETYNTKYGDYTLPINTNAQYINLIYSNNILANTIKDLGQDFESMTIEDLKENIIINSSNVNNVNPNSFNVAVSSNDPVKAQKLAQALFYNYMEYIDVMLKDRIVDHFYNNISVLVKVTEEQLNLKNEVLKKNVELLAQTPQTIDQKAAMNEIQDNKSAFIVLENIINPNYIKIENEIILNKQDISSLEISLKLYEEYLVEIKEEKEAIDQYYASGDGTGLKLSEINVAKTNIYITSEPETPSRKTSPSNLKNVVFGAVLGGIFGVIIALVRKYVFKSVK